MVRTYFLTFFTILFVNLFSQQLTISSSGEDGSSTRTNWSISGNVLSVIGTANIRASVITDALLNGSLTIVGNSNSFIVNQSEAISSIQSGRNLTIGSSANTGAITFSANISINGSLMVYGGSIALNSNLTTTLANAPILIKATNAITASGNQIFNTNNGDFILWADSDNSGQGIIHLISNPVINTANGSTSSGLSGGGKIVLAGGLDNGANGGIAGDGIPDGFAINASGIGVYFNCQSCYTQMYSGGGDIIIRGSSTFASSGVAGIGLYTDGRWLANSGKGSITLQGTSTHFFAVNLTDPGGNNIATGNKYLELISDKADGNAISIIGSSNASYGVVFNYENPKEVRATGGGAISVLGTGGSSVQGIFIQNTDLLATSGDIIMNGGSNGIRVASSGTRIGSRASSPITSSTSNIKWIANSLDLYTLSAGFTNSFNTSGTVTIEPSGTSFSNAITFPITNLTVGNNVSGLTVGKSGNTANITLAGATSIAGPISIFGGNLFAQQNLTSTLSGASILLQATGYIDVSASRTIQTNNGNITLRSNSGGTAVVLPNSTTGAITLNSGSSLLSNGGNITLGGNFDGTKGTGLYAASARVGGAPGILISGATINAAGGNINIYGRCSTSYDDGIRLQANISTTGSGSIGIYGDAFGGLTSSTSNIWFGGITFITNSSTVETESGNINIEGVLTNTQSNGTYALNFFRSAYTSGSQDRHIQIISKTGDIQITADRGTTGAGGMGHSSWGHIYFGSPLSGSWTASGDVKFSYSSFVGAGFFGYKVKTTGAVTYEPTASSFVNAQTFPHNANYTVAESASNLTIGKPSNTANITCEAVQNISGPIQIYGGDILINENLNTGAGASAGSVLLKGSGDVILAATKSITTSGAPVILWANSDNGSTNGSIALRNGSSIITGSNSVPGGHIWLGGGSDGTTWNGLAVGSGYAVPGISFTPSNGGGALNSAGIYLERNSITSFGGNIKILGDAAASGYAAIATYGNTITINAGSGKIEMDGQVTSAAAGNRMGILFGFHDNTVISTVNISSSSISGDAIKITGLGRGTEDAIGLSGTLNIIASGGGNIVMNGNAMGTGRSIVAGNYYHGILNIFANSGNISLNGNTKAVQVSAALFNGLTSGPSKINIGQGGTITSSSSDVFLTADNIALAAGGINVNTSGKVTIEPFSNSFTNAISYPISALSMSNTISGLTIGKLTNNSNVSFTSNQTIAGPISAYGGQINIGVGVNLTTSTANGHITLWGKNGFITDANSGSTRGRIMTAGGNIDINADSDDNNTGLLDIDWLTIDGNTGNVSLEGANFIWNTASGVTFPEFYGTGALSIRSSSQSTMPMNSTWIALYNTKSALTLGNPSANNSGGIDIVSCVNCNSNATNFSGKTLQVNGPITLYGPALSISQNLIANNSGTISFYGNTLTINASNTISSLGNLILTPKSNSTTIGLGGASGTLSLPVSYFSTNFSDGFANIQIGSNAQTGNIAANTFTLRDNMTFLTSGSLSLGGKPVLGNNNITLGTSISSITASANNYFQTNGAGKVMSTLANNASRLFPVGNAFYNGVTITNKTNATDTFSVLIKDSVLGNGDTGRQITTPHVKATWDISKNNVNGGNGVDFDFNWSASQEVGGISTFVLNHHNDTVWQIASGTAGSVSGTTTKSMSHTGYTGRFSPFAFGPGVTPLPVELIKFKASCQSDYIQIDWTTASEIRNKAFELYKSDDAHDWKLIYTTEGQGDKATATDYAFKDLDKNTGYYRLKDIDEDGIENWSSIIFADCKNDVSDIQIYPNPATDYIKVIAPILENTTLNIINLEGKVIKTMPLISNQNVISVKELTNGMYIINITYNNRSNNIKLLKK
jgi:hypothetical protein